MKLKNIYIKPHCTPEKTKKKKKKDSQNLKEGQNSIHFMCHRKQNLKFSFTNNQDQQIKFTIHSQVIARIVGFT